MEPIKPLTANKGDTMPKEKLTITIDDKLRAVVVQMAQQEKRSISNMIEVLLHESETLVNFISNPRNNIVWD